MVTKHVIATGQYPITFYCGKWYPTEHVVSILHFLLLGALVGLIKM